MFISRCQRQFWASNSNPQLLQSTDTPRQCASHSPIMNWIVLTCLDKLATVTAFTIFARIQLWIFHAAFAYRTLPSIQPGRIWRTISGRLVLWSDAIFAKIVKGEVATRGLMQLLHFEPRKRLEELSRYLTMHISKVPEFEYELTETMEEAAVVVEMGRYSRLIDLLETKTPMRVEVEWKPEQGLEMETRMTWQRWRHLCQQIGSRPQDRLASLQDLVRLIPQKEPSRW